MAASAEGASLEVITSIIGSDRERMGLRRAASLLRTALAVQPASPLVSAVLGVVFPISPLYLPYISPIISRGERDAGRVVLAW